jgi:alginate O-acetyltransferase complex protein AlgI
MERLTLATLGMPLPALEASVLFNSFSFLFLYLPVVLSGFFLLGRFAPRWAAMWLAMASLFFYGYWSLRYLPLLLASVVVNYWAARAILAATDAYRRRRLVAAVGLNLVLLAYYKYANFFITSINGVTQSAWPALDIVLPIGISFFTFTQIAFLVDCYHRKVSEYRFTHYVLFVSYFPHLVAGPVLHHGEMMPQFANPDIHRPNASNFAIGLSIFVIGLAKKVLIADNLAPMANPVFVADAHPAMIEAWVGTIAYTLQLYFDFSGYSDMAIGLSRLFGIELPLNFASPYKARNIAEFWRRWHMTLSRFLRDYLYIPLGGSHGSKLLRYRNLMLTMLLGGLWHGAAWTFVAWGALHGGYLVLHQWWQASRAAAVMAGRPWWPAVAQLMTVSAVIVAWIFFRADSFTTAFDVIGGMLGRNGLALPNSMAPYASSLQWLPMQTTFNGIAWIDISGPGLPALALAIVLAFAAPNTQELFWRFTSKQQAPRYAWLSWSPRRAWSVGLAGLFIGCVFSMNRVTEFLYFQF